MTRRLVALVAAVAVLVLVRAADAAVQLTPATGGTGLVAGQFGSLSGPSIFEGASGDVRMGTVAIEAPPGFEFDTTPGAVRVWISDSGRCRGNDRPLRLSSRAAQQRITAGATTIVATIGQRSTGSCRGAIHWSGIRVRALQSASGHLRLGGSSTIVGLPGGSQLGPVSAGPMPTPTSTATRTPTATPTPNPAEPPNDRFADSITLALPSSTTGNSAAASIEAGEPVPCVSYAQRTVWYRVVPPSDGILTLSTWGTGFDTVVAVYRGDSIGSLQEVGCNDNFAYQLPSQMSVRVLGGHTYHIQLGGRSELGGAFTLRATLDGPTPPWPGTTTLVSAPTDGVQLGQPTGGVVSTAAVNGDGRYATFHTIIAYDPADTNLHQDVYVRDIRSRATARVSLSSQGVQTDRYTTILPTISEDGRYVAFISDASNLVPGDTNDQRDVFVHDRATNTVRRVSVDSAGGQGNGPSGVEWWPAISGDGRYVAFESRATNLVPGDTNGMSDVYVHDLSTGATVRVSVADSGAEAQGGSGRQSISRDGRFIAFQSGANNLAPGDRADVADVFVRDMVDGRTHLVSTGMGGLPADGSSFDPTISGDGRTVAFVSAATNLVPDDWNKRQDIFVHDRATGQTTRVSVSTAGVQADDDSFSPSISGDGRYVAFETRASNLSLENPAISHSILVRDTATATTMTVSVGPNGEPATTGAYAPRFSGGSRHIGYLYGGQAHVRGPVTS